MLIEGAVPTGDDGVYCMIGGKTAESILQTVAKDAAAVIAWGSCASNGCVQAAKPNPTERNADPLKLSSTSQSSMFPAARLSPTS